MLGSRYVIVLVCAVPFGFSGAPAPGRSPEPVPDTKEAKATQEELRARDLKKLQGEWTIVREVFGGTVQKGDRGKWVFKGETVKVNNNPEGTFTLDASVRPKRLTRKFTDGEGRTRTVAYLYTFDDDQLLLSGSFPFFDEDKPPVDFASGMNFLRLERVKE